MATATATKTIEEMQAQAEKIRSDRPQKFPEAASPGDRFRQGDLYITLLGDIPADATPMKEPALQLVPGSTQGSRHCLDSGAGVQMFTLAKPGTLDGPVFRLADERTVTHPEHGHVILPGGGRCYGVHYQRDLDQEEQERRVLD